MEKPSFEDRIINVLSRIEHAIGNIAHTLETIDNHKRFPIVSPSDEVEERMKEARGEENAQNQIVALEKQNKILLRTVAVAVVSVVITAVVGLADIVLRLFFN